MSHFPIDPATDPYGEDREPEPVCDLETDNCTAGRLVRNIFGEDVCPYHATACEDCRDKPATEGTRCADCLTNLESL